MAGALTILAVFKYLNWITRMVPALAPLRVMVAGPFGDHGQVILPPGISFYIFEAISFAVDAYRGKISFPRRPSDYLTFLGMFPRFIAGPIVRYADLENRIRNWPGMMVGRGLTLFSIGFAMKICFADQFAMFVPYAFATVTPDLLQAWTGTLSYTFQLYFDFWGYSLMATGLGLCLGFPFPDNFRSPYHAASIGEFWRRWHITLSSWLRDYLYIPMGGSRVGRFRLSINLMVTMGLGGLWHGANTTFLIWGLYHGTLLTAEHHVGKDRLERIPRSIRVGATFLAVVFGWVLFRAGSFHQAADVLRGMLGLNGAAVSFNPILLTNHLFSVFFAIGAGIFCIRGERWLVRSDSTVAEIEFPAWAAGAVAVCFIFTLVVDMSSQSIPFLYFQF